MMTRFISTALAFILHFDLVASDGPDPMQSMEPVYNLTVLSQLREPLNADPENQELLGKAVMAYVNLAQFGGPAFYGSPGPWQDYAVQLSAHRSALRDGAACESFAAELPEIWADALRCDMRQVMAKLECWKDDAEDPQWLALHALAAHDVRALCDRDQLPPHARYALLIGAVDLGKRYLLNGIRQQRDGLCPSTVELLSCRGFGYHSFGHPYDPAVLQQRLYADLFLMLGSTHIRDDQAMSELQALAEVLGLSFSARGPRMRAVQDLRQQAERRVYGYAKTILHARNLAQRYVGHADRGIRDDHGRYRLFGLADVAQWMRDRSIIVARWSYWVTCVGGERVVNANAKTTYLNDLFASGDESYLTAFAGLTSKNHSAHYPGLIHRATQEALDEPFGPASSMLINQLAIAPEHGRNAMVAAMMQDRRVDEDGQLQNADGMRRFGAAIMEKDLFGDYGQLLQQAAALDPYDPWLRRVSFRLDPQETWLQVGDRPVTKEWVLPAVDLANIQRDGWPVDAPQNWFAAVIDGAIEAPSDGDYEFVLTSDDGSRLSIGGMVVFHPGQHGMSSKSGIIHLTKGHHPLRIEWHQGPGGGGCTLGWKAPADAEVGLVPASQFFHGDGKQGLRLRLYHQPKAMEAFFTADEPYNQWVIQHASHVASEMGAVVKVLDAAGRRGQANGLLRELVEDDPENYQLQLRYRAFCLQEGAGAEHIDPMITALLMVDNPQLPPLVIERFLFAIRQADRSADIRATLAERSGRRSAWFMSYILAQLDLDCGAFADISKRRNAWLYERQSPFIALSDEYFVAAMEWMLFSRMYDQKTDLTWLQRWMQGKNAGYGHIFSCLNGEMNWADCETACADGSLAVGCHYLRGLQALTCGDHAEAKAALATVVATDPAWLRAGTARCLLRWYEAADPSVLAALPKAKRPVAKAAKPGQGLDDF